MTGQLALDFTLPAGPGTVEQRAIVFTALGGDNAGQQTYWVPIPGHEDELVAVINRRATERGRTPDARVMVRTVTVGEWRPA